MALLVLGIAVVAQCRKYLLLTFNRVEQSWNNHDLVFEMANNLQETWVNEVVGTNLLLAIVRRYNNASTQALVTEYEVVCLSNI